MECLERRCLGSELMTSFCSFTSTTFVSMMQINTFLFIRKQLIKLSSPHPSPKLDNYILETIVLWRFYRMILVMHSWHVITYTRKLV